VRAPTFRPLRYGETIDRAFGIGVAVLVRSAALCAVTFGPAFGELFAAAALASVAPKVPLALVLVPAGLLWFGLAILGLGAILATLIEAYLGRRLGFRAALSSGRRAGFRLALLSLLFGLLLVVPAAVTVALYQAAVWFGHNVYVPFFATPAGAMVVAFSIVPFGLLVLVGYGFIGCVGGIAFVVCVAERSGPIESWMRAWDLAASGRRALRTLIYGSLLVFAAFAVAFAAQISIAFLVGEFPWLATPAAIVDAATSVVTQFLLLTFNYAWLVVYYFDLRVRWEGLDLRLESEALLPGPEVQPA